VIGAAPHPILTVLCRVSVGVLSCKRGLLQNFSKVRPNSSPPVFFPFCSFSPCLAVQRSSVLVAEIAIISSFYPVFFSAVLNVHIFVLVHLPLLLLTPTSRMCCVGVVFCFAGVRHPANHLTLYCVAQLFLHPTPILTPLLSLFIFSVRVTPSPCRRLLFTSCVVCFVLLICCFPCCNSPVCDHIQEFCLPSRIPLCSPPCAGGPLFVPPFI